MDSSGNQSSGPYSWWNPETFLSYQRTVPPLVLPPLEQINPKVPDLEAGFICRHLSLALSQRNKRPRILGILVLEILCVYLCMRVCAHAFAHTHMYMDIYGG